MTNMGVILYKIRKTTAADTSAVAWLHVRTFNEAHAPETQDGPPIEVREYQWRKILTKNDPYDFCIVIESEAGELIGFARGVKHNDNPNYKGALNKIYILEQYHRQGLGRQLICAVTREFLALGISSMLLFGDADSDANRFYEALGGEKLYTSEGRFDGSYGWRNLRALGELCGS